MVLKKRRIGATVIEIEKIPFADIDTITFYINPTTQPAYYEYIFSFYPPRIIFNSGTVNDELAQQVKLQSIIPQEASTLGLLSTR